MAHPARVAVCGVELTGALDEPGELLFQGAQLTDGPVDLAGAAAQQIDDLPAGRLAAASQGDHTADLPRVSPTACAERMNATRSITPSS